jgi:hypothetical protein
VALALVEEEQMKESDCEPSPGGDGVQISAPPFGNNIQIDYEKA